MLWTIFTRGTKCSSCTTLSVGLETPALEAKGSSLTSHRLGSAFTKVKPGKVRRANPALGSPQCPQHSPQPPGKLLGWGKMG